MHRSEPSTQDVISHAHARDLAECWQDTSREDHPITRLARTGEITYDAERALAYDLNLLETASAAWGSPPSIPEKQLRVLLEYVRFHGPRARLDGWQQLRDAEFLRSIRRMASEARVHAARHDAADDRRHLAPVTPVDEYRGQRSRPW